jgi:hypothetical protein
MHESNNRHLPETMMGAETYDAVLPLKPNGAGGDVQCNCPNGFLAKNSGKQPLHHPHKYCHTQAGTRRRA